jgi:hypothetical protein
VLDEALTQMGEAPRFFFVHLQKTGGTALFQRLRDAFGDAAVYPTPQDKGEVAAVLDLRHLVERLRTDHGSIQVITGHFPYCTAEVLDLPLRTFTVLRDPVERTLSVLRKRQAADAQYLGQDVETIYADPALAAVVRNHMVKMLSLTPDEIGPTPLTLAVDLDDAHLERALANLERIDVVGLQEHFDEFCALLEETFGWDLGPPRFANRTVRRAVPDGLREQIRADNAMDCLLYEHAVRLVERRAQERAARG